jgi:hypothetical protein
MPKARSSSPTDHGPVLRVLVDGDNVEPQRIEPVLALLADVPDVRVTASGSRQALSRVRWPAGTELLEHAGWQRADLALAEAYSPAAEPLLLITGDGDFGLLASRHPAPVLVISGAASSRLRDGTTVLDPAVDGRAPIAAWLATYAH